MARSSVSNNIKEKQKHGDEKDRENERKYRVGRREKIQTYAVKVKYLTNRGVKRCVTPCHLQEYVIE